MNEFDNGSEVSKEAQMVIKTVSFMVMFLVVFFVFNPIYTVGAGKRGVVLNWGAVQNEVSGEGIHLRIPIMQKIVNDPPFRVEHVAPKQTHDDGAKHHGHQNDGEHRILAPEISLQQPGNQDTQYELDGNRKPHILKGEDEAFPRICVR